MTVLLLRLVLWQTGTPRPIKTQSCNIIRSVPSLRKKNICTRPKDAFTYLLTGTIVDEIKNCTNLEVKRHIRSKNKQWQDIDMCEMISYLGIVIQAGVDKG